MRYLKLLALIISCLICGFCIAQMYDYIYNFITNGEFNLNTFAIVFIGYSASSFVVFSFFYCSGSEPYNV